MIKFEYKGAFIMTDKEMKNLINLVKQNPECEIEEIVLDFSENFNFHEQLECLLCVDDIIDYVEERL